MRSPPIQGVPRHPPESAPQALRFSREGRRGGMPVPCQAPGIESSMHACLGRSEGQLGEEGSASGSAGSQLVRAGTEGMGGAGRCIQEGFGGCFEVRLYPTGFRNHAERGESRGERGPGAVGLLVVGVARLLQ